MQNKFMVDDQMGNKAYISNIHWSIVSINSLLVAHVVKQCCGLEGYQMTNNWEY